MADELDLATTTQASGEFDLFPESGPPTVSPEVAQSRSSKYDFALGSDSPGTEEIYQKIIAGQEELLTRQFMAVERANEHSRRQFRIQELLNKANEDGTPITVEEYEKLVSQPEDVTDEILKDPSNFFKKKQAKALIDRVWDTTQPREVADEVSRLGLMKHLTKQYGVAELLQETQARADKEGALSQFINKIETFVPVFSWWNTVDALEKAPTSSFLKGTNLKEQVDYFLSHPDPDTAMVELRNAVDEIYENNPNDALAFLSAMSMYSENDQAIENAVEVFNVATGITAGLATNAARSFLKAGSRNGATVPGMLNAMGDPLNSAFHHTINRLRLATTMKASGAAETSNSELLAEIPTIANPDAILTGSSNFAADSLARLGDILKAQSEALVNTTLNTVNVARLEPGTNAYTKALEETTRLFEAQYPGINNSVLGIRPISSVKNAATNTDSISVQIGNNLGNLFDAQDEAIAFADFHQIKGFTVAQQGSKFSLEVAKSVDETLPSVRDALHIDTGLQQTPANLANRVFGFLRTKDDILPSDINREVKAATLGAQQFSGIAMSILRESAVNLRKDSRAQMLRFLETQRDSVQNGVRGTFSKTLGDFEVHWKSKFNRLPTEEEAKAYFTFVQVNDAEWMVRNFNIYKGKSRLGLEMFHFERDGVTLKVPPQIEGRLVDLDRMLSKGEDANFILWDHTAGTIPQFYRKNSLSLTEQDALKNAVTNEGYRLIQLSRYGREALRKYPGVELPDGHIDYVLVKKYTSAPLPIKQIPYRPGGHVEYAPRFFVSQPNIRKHTYRGADYHTYNGDSTILAQETRMETKRLVDNLEKARQLYNSNDLAGLKTFMAGRTHLPYTYTTLIKKFKSGEIDSSRPFYVRANGTNLMEEYKLDQFYSNMIDPKRNPHDVYNEDVNLSRAMERDENLFSAVNFGTNTDPVYGLRPSRLIDPFTTMGREITNVTRGRYLDDIKIKAAERFVREFGDVLVGDADMLRQFPMRALTADVINKGHSNSIKVAAAKNYRRALMELWGISDEKQATVNAIVNGVAETLLKTLGQGKGTKAFTWVEPHLISTVNDPTKFFRSVAFYPRMGFLNIKQLFMQGQGVVNTAAIEGADRAYKGFAAATLMRPLHLRASDTILEDAASKAATFGWKRDHFIESYLALQRTGFQNVGGEFGTLDDFLNPTVFTNRVGNALDDSLVFFRKGERANRLTAWNAAYLRWREKNPIAAFDDMAVKEVLERADLLTINMTRASNAGFNQGWASIPTQFFSYQARLMDLMLGKRLEWDERARLIMTYSALYGIPAGVGGTYLGVLWPWHAEARTQAINYGIDVNNPGWDAMINGLPQAMMNYASGGDINPSLASTFGPGGLSFFKDLFGPVIGREGKDFSEFIAGPAGKTVTDVFNTTWNLFSRLANAGYGKNEPLLYGLHGTTEETNTVLPLTKEDFLPVLRNISTFSQAEKAYYAHTLGTYFMKNSMDVIMDGHDNPWTAFFSGALGSDPQSVNDFWSKLDVQKITENAQRKSRKEAEMYFKLSFDSNISDSDRNDYWKRAKAAMIAGGLSNRQKVEVLRRAVKDRGTSEMNKIDEDLKRANKERLERYFNELEGK